MIKNLVIKRKQNNKIVPKFDFSLYRVKIEQNYKLKRKDRSSEIVFDDVGHSSQDDPMLKDGKSEDSRPITISDI